MKITPEQLTAQYQRARAQWPFLDALEQRHGLPRCLLYAVGSRETNLADEVGDGGHGHGVWQLDDRSHRIPAPFPVSLQAELAATMLAGLIQHYNGDVIAALCAYNAGAGAIDRQLVRKQDPNRATAGGDYGTDTLDRCSFLQRTLNPPPPPQEATTVLNKPACSVVMTPTGHGYWIVAGDGGVFAYGDAHPFGDDPIPAMPLNSPVVDAACTPDGQGLVLVAGDGGIFTLGDAQFFGSAAGGG